MKSTSSGSGPVRALGAPAFAGRPRPLLGWLSLALLGLAACAKPALPSRAPAAGAGSWPAEFQRSDAAQRERVSLTVYDGFALVREQRRLQLGTGRVALAFADVSAQIQPASVHLRALDGDDLVVLEQNYRYDLLTPETLLEHYVGRRVALSRYDADAGEDVVREAEVLASSKGPVLRVGGEVVSQLPSERISFPELPAGLLPRPTLVWLLDSARAEQRVEVSYLTQNLSWHADYVLSLSEDDAHADLTGWVTLDNQTGTGFNAAELQLVAGDVQRILPEPAPPTFAMRSEVSRRIRARASGLQESPLFEYHLYGLDRPTDLLAHEQKQLRLLEARGVAVERKLQLRASGRGTERSPQLQHPVLVAVLQNREQAGLGLPLPRGVVRVYRADGAGAQQFVGEDALEHTPRDEKLEIELGEAFDVVADRRRLSQRQLERCVTESEWRTELRNHKDQAVVVEVLEPARGGWTLVESTHPAETRDANAFTFRVPVAARASSELRFRLRLRTC